MRRDKQYLKKHGNQWIVVVKVPDKLRPIIGKAHLKHPLHTDSLAVANRDKFKIVAALKEEIERARRGQHTRDKAATDSITEEALQWRDGYLHAQDGPDFHGGYDEDGNLLVGSESVITSLAVERAEEIEKREGYATAKAFYDVATNAATPILLVVDMWLAEKLMKPRQNMDYRRAIEKLDAWLVQTKLGNAVERCTRKIAGRYISEAFVEREINVRTANKDISALSTYWKWLERKGYALENIWAGQSLPKPKLKKNEKPRPFTDDELTKLFVGKTSLLLRDMMAIAALSGMRVEEIASLTVADTANSCFDITEAKTTAGIRKVPIHSALTGIVSRRSEGKGQTEPLFDELPTPKEGSATEKSQRVVKAFTTYRRKMGVDDRPEGSRLSRVTFHSFRRWFITKAEQAGQEPHIIEAVVGHQRAGMSLGKYSGGPSEQQFRSVVEAVKLPDECNMER